MNDVRRRIRAKIARKRRWMRKGHFWYCKPGACTCGLADFKAAARRVERSLAEANAET